MQCLIIAAGLGRRLSSRGDSKPLVPLLGLPLIERVILNAKGAGLSEFCVVTGYQGERVRRFLDQLAGRRQVSITHVVNEEWQKNNGLSVLRAKNALKGDFVLLMTDHLFDEQVLMNLRGQRVEEGEVLLAVDRNVKGNPNVDIDDVTKVLVEDGRILDIGKDIERYNAYDTGVFLCTPAIFAALEESMNNGDSTLSGGVRVLAEKGKAKAFDIGDRWWIDVDDEEAFGKAERALIAGLDKPSDGPISRHLNRPLSTRITRLLLRTNLTPNAVSLISFALSVVGSLSFFMKGYTGLAVGGILAQLSSVVDGCDGEIARLKHQATDFGAWFDAVLDRYADAFLLFGLTWHASYANAGLGVMLTGFLAIVGTLINSYTADKYDGFMRRKLTPGRHYFRIGRDVRMFVIFLGALFNQAVPTLGLIALVMNVENVRRILLLYRNERR